MQVKIGSHVVGWNPPPIRRYLWSSIPAGVLYTMAMVLDGRVWVALTMAVVTALVFRAVSPY